MSKSTLLFLRQQSLLALDAPAVSAEAAVLAHHAMAGHDRRDRIGGAGAGHGAGRAWSLQTLRNLFIAAGLAEGDLLQLLPHADLEGGGLEIKGQLQPALLAAQEVEHLAHVRLECGLVFAEGGVLEFTTHLLQHGSLALAEADLAHALGRGSDQQKAER